MATRVHAYVADRKPRTVIGVVLSSSRSGLVVQSRGRRYTVVAASGASVSLNGKPTSLGAIHEGDHVHAAGRLNGSTLSATRIVARRLPPKHVIVRGAITQINGSNLVIVDSSGSRRRVHLAPGAHVILAGKAAPGLALFPGVHASARGAMSGGTLVATTLTLTVRSRTVTGRLTRVTPNRIGVGLTSGRSVRIDLPHGATMSDGGKRITVGAMRIGAYVRVHGYVESSSSVRAMAVHVLHPTLDFSAVVVANSGAMVVRTSGGERYQLRLSSASQLTTGRENVDLTPAEVPVGVRVHARGRMGSDGALAISVLSVRLTSQTLRGTVSALGPQSLTLQATTGPVNVHLTGRTAIAQGSHTLVASDIVVGDDITVYGYNGGTGIELARKVLVHRKLIGIDGTVASLTADGFTLNSADGPHRVIVSSATIITGTTTTIATGLPVHVTGYRRGDGVILATRLRFKKK